MDPDEVAVPPEADAPLMRSYEALIDDVRPGERSVIARINTAAIDRFRTVIDPLGADLEAYRTNPVVLWEHGLDPVRGRVPIGRNSWIKVRKADRDILAKTVFGDDEFSRTVFGLYQDGGLRGFSIQFGPGFVATLPTQAEIRSRPEMAGCKAVLRSWKLVEYSAVAVPGNSETLALAVSRGLWVPDAVRTTLAPPPAALPPFPQKPELPEFSGRRLASAIESRRSAIVAQAEDLRARLDLRRGIV